MILVYTNKITERLKFSVGTILKGIIGVNYELTTNKKEFLNSALPCINYSFEDINKGVKIHPYKILYELGIKQEDPPFLIWNDIPVLYPQKNTDFPFDIFAATFYMLSRYEEYLPFPPDDHERFPATESLAYKEGFIDRPVVDEWARQLKLLLTVKFPELKFNSRKFSYLSTIDIDRFYNQRYNDPVQSLLGSGKSLLSARPDHAFRKLFAAFKFVKDPWDVYDYLAQLRNKHQIKHLFFIHCGERSKNDMAIPLYFREIRDRLRIMAIESQVGLHPSYISNYDNKLLREEKISLEYLTNVKITRSRQHYLKFALPVTYRKLYKFGIREEYSMGFADHYGFRAGTSLPFYFYDLEMEMITPIKIHPFAYMDDTLKNKLNLTRDESKVVIQRLIDRVKQVNGAFSSIWHNSSLSNWAEWKGWRDVYEFEIDCQKTY